MLSWLPNLFELHLFDLHVLQDVVLMFATPADQKGVCGGISIIIHLCNVDDISLHCS